VDPGAELDAERRRAAQEGCRAADGLAGGIEGGQQAVRVAQDQLASMALDQVPGRIVVRLGTAVAGRPDVQEGRQHTVGLARRHQAGQEPGYLGVQDVAVLAGGEP
jgi:hypothetical protein